MRIHNRHMLWLVLLLSAALGLSGCYQSAGGTLEPTPASQRVMGPGDVALMPSFTPAPDMADQPTATDVFIPPTSEQVTDLPASNTPLPTIPPPSPTATFAEALPDQGGGPTDTGPAVAMGPSATFTAAPASATPLPTIEPPTPTPTNVPPSQTTQPSQTPLPTIAPPTFTPSNTALPTIPPASVTPTMTVPPSLTPQVLLRQPAVVAPSATPFVAAVAFAASPTEAVPVQPIQPAPPTQTMPPAQPVESVPLAERPTDTPAPAPVGDQGGQAVAMQPTLIPAAATATELVRQATANAAATLGTPMFATPDPFAQPGVTPLPPIQQGITPGAVVIATPTPTGQCDEHLISPGETLSRIALLYNVTLEQIVEANLIVNPDLIKAGETLIIPCPLLTTPTPIGGVADGQGGFGNPAGPTGQRIVYIVEPGDNIYRLSIRFNVTMSDIMAANGLTVATMNTIYAGQELIIPASTTTQTITITVTPSGAAPIG